MKTFSRERIIESLEREGLVFTGLAMKTCGNYNVEDADWNIKDIVHAHYVHDGLENISTVVHDEFLSMFSVINFMGIKVPVSSVLYDPMPNVHVICTSVLCFAMVVESRYEQISENETVVHTAYSVGAPKIFSPFFPIIRKRIAKHFQHLMKDDMPMRERRGKLRSWGYRFKGYNKKGRVPGFKYMGIRSLELEKSNVIVLENTNLSQTVRINLNEELSRDGEHLVGRDDHLGLEIVRRGNNILIYPRMCSHDGASLDASKCVGRIKRLTSSGGKRKKLFVHGMANCLNP